MTIMTNRGLKSVLKERVKFGVDVDAAVISEGVGYSAESTVRLADIYILFLIILGFLLVDHLKDLIYNLEVI